MTQFYGANGCFDEYHPRVESMVATAAFPWAAVLSYSMTQQISVIYVVPRDMHITLLQPGTPYTEPVSIII
jgi:hypothetical protein